MLLSTDIDKLASNLSKLGENFDLLVTCVFVHAFNVCYITKQK